MNEKYEIQPKPPDRSGPWLGRTFDPFAGGMTTAAEIALFAMMAMMTAHILGRKVGPRVSGPLRRRSN